MSIIKYKSDLNQEMNQQDQIKKSPATQSINNKEDCLIPQVDQPIQDEGDHPQSKKEDSNSEVVEVDKEIFEVRVENGAMIKSLEKMRKDRFMGTRGFSYESL